VADVVLDYQAVVAQVDICMLQIFRCRQDKHIQFKLELAVLAQAVTAQEVVLLADKEIQVILAIMVLKEL
jgi:hypothetical protein